jgi:endonuclease YncB( thermonuclease family)
MKPRGLLLLGIIAVVFAAGCTSQTGQITQDTNQPICNPPYIVKGYDCCLDENSNKICDSDEKAKSDETNNLKQEKFVVSNIIDGDTVQLSNGETIRLLGINTPEMGQQYYEESKNRLKELIEGKTVTLEKDADDKDQYGRLLRFIFLDDENINIELVREGLAAAYIIPPNVKYETELREAENEAKDLEIGIWTSPTPGENVCDDRCIGISYFHWNAEGDDCYNLNDEYVTFKNSCPYHCDMTNWTVKDESSRNLYVFPTFVLEGEKTVTLYTGCGTNTNAQLYWCNNGYSCNSVWNNNGDTLYLRDSEGNFILDYNYSGFQ